jgi:hypothetical protein
VEGRLAEKGAKRRTRSRGRQEDVERKVRGQEARVGGLGDGARGEAKARARTHQVRGDRGRAESGTRGDAAKARKSKTGRRGSRMTGVQTHLMQRLVIYIR